MTANVAHLTKCFPKFSKNKGKTPQFCPLNQKVTENFLDKNFTLNVGFRPSDRQLAKNVRRSTVISKLEPR